MIAPLQDLRAQDREATDRLARLDSRVAQRVAQARAQRERLEARIRSVQRVLADEAVVARAGRRLPLATEVVRRREDRVLALRDAVQDLARRRDAVAGLGQRLASLEREAGQAALQAEDLSRRLA
ncbi:MAG: hypothetical protein IPG83_01925 [Novosphingobium sp.]|nr:hypothetical protein [Novosphingobium sp.]